MYKIAKYVISGVLATAMNLSLTYALTDFGGLWYVYSSIAGFCAAISVSFTLQKFWTFRSNIIERMHIEAVQFLAVAMGGLLFDVAAVYTLVEYAGLHYLIAQFLIGIGIAVANFLFYHMIFRGKERRALKTLWREELSGFERGLIIAGALILILLAVKSFGIDLPYHQDEWKYARFIVDSNNLISTIHHPPLTGFLLRFFGSFLPPELLRLLPLFFTGLSYGLFYIIMERRAGFKASILSLIVLGSVAYGTLGSLMLDTDGAIVPFFMLLAVLAYDHLITKTQVPENRRVKRYFFGALFATAVILGFLVKLSFIIVLGALVLDYLFERRNDITTRLALRLAGALALVVVAVVTLVAIVRYLQPSFNITGMLAHALSYVQGFDRGWGQIVFQSLKAVIYTGPIAFVVLFLRSETFERVRFFVVYLALGLVFYLVLFDFSQGALDKYLLFVVVPIAAISGVVLAEYLPKLSRVPFSFFLTFLILAAFLILLNFLPQDVLPLYPKSAWAKEMLSLHWNILLPFMGGSGPVGFYVSFLFVAATFTLGALIAAVAIFKTRFRAFATMSLLALSLVYTAVFTEELFWGRINGSTPLVLEKSLAYIAASDDISSVITHNDIGAFELWRMEKYDGRFYAVPSYEEGHKELFASHTGHYLVIDMPRFNSGSFYTKFFRECSVEFETRSGVITGRVYSCPTVASSQ